MLTFHREELPDVSELCPSSCTQSSAQCKIVRKSPIQHRFGSAVPVGDVRARADLPHSEALLNALEVMLEPVGHKHGLAVGGFDDVLQGIQLPLVEEQAAVLGVVDPAVRQLAQLAGQGRGVDGIDLRAVQGHHQLTLQGVIGLALRRGQLHGHAV